MYYSNRESYSKRLYCCKAQALLIGESLDSGDNTLSTKNYVKELYIVRRFLSTQYANMIKIKLEFDEYKPKSSLVNRNTVSIQKKNVDINLLLTQISSQYLQ